jgi:chromate transporter
MPPAPRTHDSNRGPGKVGLLDIFLAFTRISVTGFGSPLYWSHYVLVERKRWVTEEEFVQLMALAQLLPGPNASNLSVIVGHRFGGYAGVASAVAGFMGWPFLIVIAVAMLYERYGELALVQQALSGMSAVAAGLLLATGIRMTRVLGRKPRPWVFCALAFAGVGAMRWPLVSVVAVLVPLALAAEWWKNR